MFVYDVMPLTSSSALASPFSAGASGAFSSGFAFSTSLDFLGLAGTFFKTKKNYHQSLLLTAESLTKGGGGVNVGRKKEVLETSSHLWLRFGLWLWRCRSLWGKRSLISALRITVNSILVLCDSLCLHLST